MLFFLDGNVGITRNARKVANLMNPETKNYLEVDVWMPSLKLCFEFQVISVIS